MRNFPPIVIPVKAFLKAKIRLSPRLSSQAREELAREMATHVVVTAKDSVRNHDQPADKVGIFVVCDDEEVASWAKELGVETIWSEGHNLNGSIELAALTLASQGFAEMIVAHSDLPNAKDFLPMLGGCPISMAPDRHKDGTNVLRVPLNAGFEFCYGAHSFANHLAEARRLDLEVEIVEKADLALDIDVAEDLDFMNAVEDGS